MKKVNKQTIILDALQKDAKDNGIGLSIPELARIVFGNFHRNTTKFHEKKISTYMGKVCELGADNQIIVFAVKVSTNKKTPEIKSRIARWRIFNPEQLGCKEEYIDALLDKKKNAESHTKSFIRMFTFAKEAGILSEGKLKNLGMSIQ